MSLRPVHHLSLTVDTSMRRSARAGLALLLLSVVPTGPPDVPQNAVHIVDEGYLLHIVVWLSPATYAEICQSYVRYIQTHY